MHALYLLAGERMKAGYYQDSINLYDQLIEEYPDCDYMYKVYHNIGYCFSMLGLYDAAIDRYNMALLQTVEIRTILSKAYAFYQLENYGGSLNALRQGICTTSPESDAMKLLLSFREIVYNKMCTLSQPLQSAQQECTGMEDLEDVVPFGTSIPYDQNQTLLGSFIDMYLNSN